MTPEWKRLINFCPKSALHPRYTCRGKIWRKSEGELTNKRRVRSRYCTIFIPHLYLAPPRENFVKMFDAGKTWIIGLPYGEKTMTICQAVFIWYRNVSDGRTDGRTDLLYQYRASVCWRAVKMLTRPRKLPGPWTTTRSKQYLSVVHPLTCSLLWVRCLFDPLQAWGFGANDPWMETYYKFLPKICVAPTIHVSWPNLANIGRQIN